MTDGKWVTKKYNKSSSATFFVPKQNEEECEHCLPKSHCIWCSDKYPDKSKLDIQHCKICHSMTNHYDGACLRCKTIKEDET